MSKYIRKEKKQNKRITIWIVIAMVLALGSFALAQLIGNGAYIVGANIIGAAPTPVLVVNGGVTDMAVLPGQTGNITATVTPNYFVDGGNTYDLYVKLTPSAGFTLNNLEEEAGATTCEVTSDGTNKTGTVVAQVGYYVNGQWKTDKVAKNVKAVTVNIKAWDLKINGGAKSISPTDYNPINLTATVVPEGTPVYWEVPSIFDWDSTQNGSLSINVTPKSIKGGVIKAYLGYNDRGTIKPLDNGAYSTSVTINDIDGDISLGDGSPTVLYTESPSSITANVSPEGAPIIWNLTNATVAPGCDIVSGQPTTNHNLEYTVNPTNYNGATITASLVTINNKGQLVADTIHTASVQVDTWQILVNGGITSIKPTDCNTIDLTATVYPAGTPVFWAIEGPWNLNVTSSDGTTCSITPQTMLGGTLTAYLGKYDKGTIKKVSDNYKVVIPISDIDGKITLGDGDSHILYTEGPKTITAHVTPDGAPIIWNVSGATVTDGTPTGTPTYDYELEYTIDPSNRAGADIKAYMTKNSGGTEVKDTGNYAAVHLNEWYIVLNDGINPMNVGEGGPTVVKATVYPENEELVWTNSNTANALPNGVSYDTHEYSFWGYLNANGTLTTKTTTLTAAFKSDTNKKASITVDISNEKLPPKALLIDNVNVVIEALNYNENVFSYTTSPMDENDAKISWIPMHEAVGSGIDPSLMEIIVRWSEENQRYEVDVQYNGNVTQPLQFHLHCIYGTQDIEDYKIYGTLLPSTSQYKNYNIEFAGEDGTYKGQTLEEYGYDFTVPQGGGTQLIVVAIDKTTGEEVIIPASDVLGHLLILTMFQLTKTVM